MLQQPTNRRTFLGVALLAAAISLPGRTAMAAKNSTRHVVLLGDSVFDHSTYVSGGPDVAQQLRERLPPGSRVTLAASDGTVTPRVKPQLQSFAADATHVVVSMGGNDALRHSSMLDENASSVSEVLDKLAGAREKFERDYRAMLDGVMRLGVPTAVCTIYDARFSDPKQRLLASVGLTVFNECVTREAAARGIVLIDLRLICNAEGDIANAIEPSVFGGAKIANVIAQFASEYHSRRRRSDVFSQAGNR